jgi:serine/threonine-protein kinase
VSVSDPREAPTISQRATSALTGGNVDDLPADQELAEGTIVGEYLIRGALAHGGCGVVYVAEHRVLGRRAALKVLRSELAECPDMVERFVREARAANLIRHPNIIDIYDFAQLKDGRPYYVMELLEGTNLGGLIERYGGFSPEQILDLLEPVCAALSAAHAAGIIHRDLKANNIVVVDGPTSRVIKLLDFGIAKLVHPDPSATGLTSVGRRLGTPHTMAPEQIRGGTIDARTDVYSLGVLLYQLLTGHAPFHADDPLEIERMHLEAPPPRPSQVVPVAPELDQVVLRCMDKEQSRRYESVDVFLEALRQAVQSHRGRTASGTGHSARVVPAVAIYVEARIEPEAQDAMDDPLLDDLSCILDTTEQAVRSAGFSLQLQTGNALLAVLLLPEDPQLERRERERALTVAVGMGRELAQRQTRDRRVHVNLCVHADSAVVRPSAAGPEVVGGGVVNVTAWAPQAEVGGVCATPRTLAGLPDQSPSGAEPAGHVTVVRFETLARS